MSKVDISDLLDNLDRDSKLRLMNQSVAAIKTDTDSQFSDEHLEIHFESGDILKIDVTTRPMADIAFRFKLIEKK